MHNSVVLKIYHSLDESFISTKYSSLFFQLKEKPFCLRSQVTRVIKTEETKSIFYANSCQETIDMVTIIFLPMIRDEKDLSVVNNANSEYCSITLILIKKGAMKILLSFLLVPSKINFSPADTAII